MAAAAVALIAISVRMAAVRDDKDMILRAETSLPAYQYRYSKIFNDINSKQLVSARKVGVEPVENREQASHGRLRRVESCRLYEVEPLTHSIPYLVPEAKRLLRDIGKGFRDSLAKYELKGFCPVVTSLTRTKDDVRPSSKKRQYKCFIQFVSLLRYDVRFVVHQVLQTRRDREQNRQVGADETGAGRSHREPSSAGPLPCEVRVQTGLFSHYRKGGRLRRASKGTQDSMLLRSV